MENLYVLAKINGAPVAISSKYVESVVRVQDVVPVPHSKPIVAGLFALRSRVLTLIDSQLYITGKQGDNFKNALAVVTQIGGHSYGLVVDHVDDVVLIDHSSIEMSLNPGVGWDNLVTGAAFINDEMVMIIDTGKLVSGSDAMAA